MKLKENLLTTRPALAINISKLKNKKDKVKHFFDFFQQKIVVFDRESRLGIIGVDYGIGQGRGLAGGLVHVGVMNKF